MHNQDQRGINFAIQIMIFLEKTQHQVADIVTSLR
jgi:hypothetical protein